MTKALDRTRIQIAKPDILAYFAAHEPILRTKQVASILSEERKEWRLAKHTKVDDFIAFLKKSGQLREHTFAFPNRPETLFSWGDVPVLELLLHLKAHSYYSHYTAMRLHGLTEQVPKTVYLSHERSSASPMAREITQKAIDDAFSRPVRASNNAVDYGDWRVMLLNGAHTGELGVVELETRQDMSTSAHVRITDLERTLIDAAVRPAYSGGVSEVAKAFEAAKGDVSVNAMGAMLGKLKFAYPYHQAIGFYLERAGYRQTTVDLMRRSSLEFDFYLAHDMGPTRYVPHWRLHVPIDF